MSDRPLMPKATAVWLIDNTALTFDQIADFCGLHALEVKGIADGDVAAGVRGIDPIGQHQLTREEIEKAEKDEDYMMKLSKPKTVVAPPKKKAPRYTPLSRRQERPNAIAWIVRNHPEVPDAQITKLLGTTKTTIQAIRNKTHWNSPNLEPQDPVALGLCSQFDLDMAVSKAAEKRAAMTAEGKIEEGPQLAPAAETEQGASEERAAPDIDKIFANFGGEEDKKED
ncbi:MAG: cell cycle transcriptional regulator TrcR [Pseudomonadota bacterium]